MLAFSFANVHYLITETVALILNIPLPLYWSCDRRFWHLNLDGIYSVKTGYWLGKLRSPNSEAQQVDMHECNLWRQVWKLDGPPKLRHFVWRACKGSLAVKERLHYRHIAQSKVCDLCGEQEETITHSLFSCNFSKLIWRYSGLDNIIEAAPSVSFTACFSWLMEKLNAEDVLKCMTLAWASWFCRNKALYDNRLLDPVMTAKGFIQNVSDYTSYARSVFQPQQRPQILNSTRLPPPSDWVKINVDAHIITGGGHSLGAVIRNNEGKVLLAGVQSSEAVWAIMLAEAAAVRFGLLLARRFGWCKVIIECDSLAVVNDINKRKEGYTQVHQILDDIHRISLNFTDFACVHIKRVGNCVAHHVARECVSRNSETVFCDPIPQGISTLAEMDIHQ